VTLVPDFDVEPLTGVEKSVVPRTDVEANRPGTARAAIAADQQASRRVALKPDGEGESVHTGSRTRETLGGIMSGDPFVGRTVQLAQLRAWADEVAETGSGRFVLVVGEPGAGKTRLCSEFARLSLPSAVAWSRCWVGGGGPPLWPWPDLVAELASRRRMTPELIPATEHRDRFGLFRTVEDQLRDLCAEQPAIALIDDLHAANQDVWLLTRYVARSLHRFPMLLVVTWRTGSSVESSEDFAALARDASVVDLPPFSADDVASYLELSGHDPITPDEIAQLVACTGGNPMYVAELVRQQWTGEADRTGGLALVLARRVADVSAARRRVLGAAALLGPGATVADVTHILRQPPTNALEALSDESVGATLVGNGIRFSHELLRAAYAAALPEAERQQLHVAARDAISGGDVDRVVRRASHAVEAAPISRDDGAKAVAACGDAAAMLQRALAFEQAAEWAARACVLASRLSSPAVEATALLTHANAVLACGRLSDARELFSRAVQPAEAASNPRLLARAALGLGGVWVEEQRDELSRRRMLNLCRRALAALPPDEGMLAARLGVRLAAEAAYDGTATVNDVAVAVEHVRQRGDPSATAEALSLYHHTLLLPDKAAVRLQIADELLDVASNAEATMYSLFGLCWRTVDLYHLGCGEAERAFVDLRERTTAIGNQSLGYIVAVLDVMRTFRRGELERAEALAGEAFDLGVAVGDADALGYYGGHVLAVRWAQGRIGEMLDTISSVIESSTLRRRDQVYRALLAYAHVLRGDHATARLVLDALLAGGLDAIPSFSTWTGTMAVMVETAAELGDGQLAMALAERFAPIAHLPVMPSLAVVCLGPGERVMGRAMATAGRLDEAIAWFRAALEANRRVGNRPFDAIIRANLAATLQRRRRRGDGEEAAELLTEAITEGRRLGMTGWVAQWQADAPGLGDRNETSALAGTLERDDGIWRVGIGDRWVTVKHVVGMRYVAELVARPDTEIAASDLSIAINGAGVVGDAPSDEPTLDDRAREEYRRRLRQLDHELDVADRRGDADRGRRAAEERDLILDALRRETGLGGRPRRMTDESERCRMRVSKAVHRALEHVCSADVVLGRALESRIRTGYVCQYVSDPGQPIVWKVRPMGPNVSD
jgi:tetratricopeptide (TPR) repeat protein